MVADLKKTRKAEKERAKERAKLLRKDRLIQTRVDRRLHNVLQEQARKRRMSVSNLVRNLLEDAFGLTDPDVGPVLEGGVESVATSPSLEHIYAWNAVVLGKTASCSRCAAGINAGDSGLIGLSEDPSADRAWLCASCGEDL